MKIESRRSGPPWRDVELSFTFYHGEADHAMTNEELVALIQGGDQEKLPQLWEQVERFVAQQANRRLVLSGGLGGVEFGDLYNAGYLALVAAVDTFDPEAGRSFYRVAVPVSQNRFCGGRRVPEPQTGNGPAPPRQKPGGPGGG